MADRNHNFLRDSINKHNQQKQQSEQYCQHNKVSTNRIDPIVINNNLTEGADASSTQVSSPTKKEGLYVKKDNSNYQRFVEYTPKDALSKKINPDAVLSYKEQHVKMGLAPLVGWQNGSPTLFPSSPEDHYDPIAITNNCSTKKNEAATSKIVGRDAVPETLSESSGIGKDPDEDTENLSSIANERGIPSTPGLTIDDKSLESFSQDGDHSLATVSNPDFDEDFDTKQLNFDSPGSECTEDRIPATPTESFLTSPNLTVGVSPTDKQQQQSQDQGKKTLKKKLQQKKSVETTSLDIMQDFLVKRQYSESDSRNGLSSPIYEHKEQFQNEEDSIGGSNAILEIFDNIDYNELENLRNDSRKKPAIPDGGWGWVVVISSLVISMIADGVSFSFGLLYVKFLDEFQASKANTAWIGSLFMAVPLLSGPIMSALVDRYGCRKMTIIGGLISGTGFILSSFVNSIGVMYLTFGVLSGLGLGLCYVTAVVSIAFWFDKKRTLAVGLGACGTGIGTFVYAPMTTFFIETYGWRGCVLLLAGTFFNMIVCGTVMRDPEWWVLEQKKQQQLMSPKKMQSNMVGGSGGGGCNGSSSKSQDGERSHDSPVDEEFPGVEELRRLMKSGKAPEYLLQNLRTSTEARSDPDNSNPTSFRSVVNLPTYVRQSEKVPLEVLESLSSNSRLYNVILENYPSLLLCRSASDKKLDDSNGDIVNNKSGITMSMRLKKARDRDQNIKIQSGLDSTHESTKVLAARRISRKDLEEANPLLAKEVAQAMIEAEQAKSVSRHHLPGCSTGVVRTDSLPWLRRQFSTNTHYFKDIRVHRNSVMYRGAVLNLHKYRLRASSCPNIYRNSMTTLAKENEEKWYSELVDLLKGMMDFSMFSELHFLLLSLSTILLFTWFIVPYFYLAEHLQRQGYPDSTAANLLSYIGITNTIGMIVLGWAGDQPWMNVTKTYTYCLVACGISTILMPVFTNNFYALVITSCCFGLFFASNFSFTPVILVEIIPLERFTTAYGLSLLCQGIGNLLGPPLAGWIFDFTGHWDLSFIMAGGWIIVSGLLMGIIPYTKNRKIWGSGPVETERERECAA